MTDFLLIIAGGLVGFILGLWVMMRLFTRCVMESTEQLRRELAHWREQYLNANKKSWQFYVETMMLRRLLDRRKQRDNDEPDRSDPDWWRKE